jgi:hypothetical protein
MSRIYELLIMVTSEAADGELTVSGFATPVMARDIGNEFVGVMAKRYGEANVKSYVRVAKTYLEEL